MTNIGRTLGEWYDDHNGHLWTIFGGVFIGLGIEGFTGFKEHQIWKYGLLVLGIWATYKGGKLSREVVADLKSKLGEATRQRDSNRTVAEMGLNAAELLIEREVHALYTKLAFGNHERISVFYNVENVFVQVARYSLNPVYKLQGRSSYPIGQGCIGIAWREGRSFCDNLPDPSNSPAAYANALIRDFGFDKQTVEGMRMKSRNLLAATLLDDRGMHPVGIIVLESTDCQKMGEVETMRVIETEFLERLRPLVDTVGRFKISPTVATLKGY